MRWIYANERCDISPHVSIKVYYENIMERASGDEGEQQVALSRWDPLD